MNDATQQPEEGHLENQEAKAPEAAEAAPAPEAAPEVEPEVKAEAPAAEEPAPLVTALREDEPPPPPAPLPNQLERSSLTSGTFCLALNMFICCCTSFCNSGS